MFCNDRVSFIDIFRGGVGVRGDVNDYLFCLIKYLFGFVNMLFVFVYFIFNDLGIKCLCYIFRLYFVDFFLFI